jgi:hypothetical protein
MSTAHAHIRVASRNSQSRDRPVGGRPQPRNQLKFFVLDWVVALLPFLTDTCIEGLPGHDEQLARRVVRQLPAESYLGDVHRREPDRRVSGCSQVALDVGHRHPLAATAGTLDCVTKAGNVDLLWPAGGPLAVKVINAERFPAQNLGSFSSRPVGPRLAGPDVAVIVTPTCGGSGHDPKRPVCGCPHLKKGLNALWYKSPEKT